MVWDGRAFSYGELAQMCLEASAWLDAEGVAPGSVVSLEGSLSADFVSLWVACWEAGCTMVPLCERSLQEAEALGARAQVQTRIILTPDAHALKATGREVAHPLLSRLQAQHRPALVLFSSATTGRSKGLIHDARRLLAPFETPRRPRRILAFFLADHIGGINTMLRAFSGGGCLIVPKDRTPDAILSAVQQHQVDTLPASPTFLRLMLLADCFRHPCPTLETISYGTEVMPSSTLEALQRQLPHVQLRQLYGMSELGILPFHSDATQPQWLATQHPHAQARVVDGILQVKTSSSLLGTLDDPANSGAGDQGVEAVDGAGASQGWFSTGDAALQEGNRFRVLGRQSAMINVGGAKTFPAEIEEVLLRLDGVEEVQVYGAPHPLTGQIVVARVRLHTPEDPSSFRIRLRKFCQDKLPPYKIPQKIELTQQPMLGKRLKKTIAG